MSLFVEQSFWIFFIITVVLGGGAAYMGGRALAQGWRPIWILLVYMLIFGAGVRFLHFALFQANLFSGQYYISHTLILIAFALTGYRVTRVNQMTEKYPWLYEKTSPVGWKDKT
ncbi:MAG: hypothetical protein KGO94_13860 [Alphaproteobacteria bacterium]|nr:hypothetical protein [Alphaproteobacteria bacterium]